MSVDDSGARLRGSVLFAVAIVLAYIAVGALAGVVWQWIWTPPVQVVQQKQLFYLDYGSLRQVFTGTGLYVLVAAVASALVALVAALLTRRHELLVLSAVTLGALAAAYTMHTVGVALGPSDPTSFAKTAADGAHVQAQLVVNGKTPYLVWPMVSLFVLALVFFALPAVRTGRRRADGSAAPDAEVSMAEAQPTAEPTTGRQRLVAQIESAQFKPVSLRKGFEMVAVDGLLDRAAGAVARGEPLEPVLDVTLPVVRGEAYDKAEVTAFLDRVRGSAADVSGDPVVAEVAGSSADLSPGRQRLVERIRSARFTPVRVTQGFEMTTVDGLLDRAAEAVTRGERLDPVLDVTLPMVRLREGYDMAEVTAFLASLRVSADEMDPRT